MEHAVESLGVVHCGWCPVGLSERLLAYLLSFIFWIFFAVWILLIGGSLYLPSLFSVGLARWVGRHWAIGTVLGCKYILGVSIEVEGVENIDQSKPFLIASQHQSAVETIVFLYLFDKTASYILKRELTKVPIFGYYLRPMGMIIIDRAQKLSSLKQVLSGAKDLFQKQVPVVIFPSGTRSKYGERIKIQRSVIAVSDSCPGVSVHPTLLDSGKTWPKGFLIRPFSTIRFKILPAMPHMDDTKEKLNFLSEQLNQVL